jgi:hypothetical protein
MAETRRIDLTKDVRRARRKQPVAFNLETSDEQRLEQGATRDFDREVREARRPQSNREEIVSEADELLANLEKQQQIAEDEEIDRDIARDIAQSAEALAGEEQFRQQAIQDSQQQTGITQDVQQRVLKGAGPSVQDVLARGQIQAMIADPLARLQGVRRDEAGNQRMLGLQRFSPEEAAAAAIVSFGPQLLTALTGGNTGERLAAARAGQAGSKTFFEGIKKEEETLKFLLKQGQTAQAAAQKRKLEKLKLLTLVAAVGGKDASRTSALFALLNKDNIDARDFQFFVEKFDREEALKKEDLKLKRFDTRTRRKAVEQKAPQVKSSGNVRNTIFNRLRNKTRGLKRGK